MSNPIETENTGTKFNNEGTDNDVHVQLLNLIEKVAELEKEKKDLLDDFNAQRAKLQKLYLHNEKKLFSVTSEQVRLKSEVERLTKELDEAKSQLCIAGIIKENEVEAEKRKVQAEIATLNEIVQDTVEVSNTSQSEVKTLKQITQLLESQVNKLRGEKEKEGLLLAPGNMLSGAKTLAKKVVWQLGNDSECRLQDRLEDSMKKAQEDTKMLRSLVIPLEEKIQELTIKLQASEERLKKYEPDYVISNECSTVKKSSSELSRNASQDSANYSPKKSETKPGGDEAEVLIKLDESSHKIGSLVSPTRSVSCDMCANYEAQLVLQQKLAADLQAEKEKVEKNTEKLKDDLIKETQFRKTMEDKWNEKKEEHKAKVLELKTLYEESENELRTLQSIFAKVRQDVENQLSQLSIDRRKVRSQLQEIQNKNDILMGKHTKHSEQLREESINFPDNVEELQILLLKTHEDLIAAKVAEEAKGEQVTNLQCEIVLLREQLSSVLMEREVKENSLALENSELNKSLAATHREINKFRYQIEKLSASDKDQKTQIETLTLQKGDLMKEKRKCEEDISKLQSRVASLQQQLDTNEAVQKDFVRLSQSLQIELEKIRGADTEVRWQHEDDIDECPSCRSTFSSGRKKDHCRHCGQIFCPSCLSYEVLSGPRRRPSRVCQVCHTLLNREIAPYFSQEPPHSPD